MQVTMKKSGDSAAVHIPAAILRAAKLDMDATVYVREEAGRIVIEPVPTDELDLAAMIEVITPDNLHGAIEDHLQDIEDARLAGAELENVLAGRSETVPLEAVLKRHNLKTPNGDAST
ncbi:AbrB/MazE/SpoVT family DNA-binding domain-containing protein [Niveispirillum lacus]|uniref:AbrB/MazE/SpoVT family DNA-binding domain-containing protein n=1 Tax=Niveispirillum lacus TaxID=1981099 RepID=UPI001FE2CF7D|nr:hypothetical protein [Niveispirillum lacus]